MKTMKFHFILNLLIISSSLAVMLESSQYEEISHIFLNSHERKGGKYGVSVDTLLQEKRLSGACSLSCFFFYDGVYISRYMPPFFMNLLPQFLW